MNFIVLGYRNLLRNARRSLAVVMTIAIGFAAVTLFAGYMKMVYRGLADQAIYGELIGHLTISKRGMATEGRLHPEKYLLTKDEIARITNAIRAAEAEWFIASRLALSGILSNGRASTVFIAEGVNPADMQVLRGPRVMASGALKVDQTNGVTLADGLAGVLGLHEGDDAAVLVSTIYGQANASDVSIIDVFSTGNAGTSDKFMFIPLSLARLLSDADERADRLTLIQREGTPDEERRQKLADTLNATGLDLEVRSWEEMSGFYRQVKSMFDMIFGFLLAIVLTIVVMSVANSMSMGVIERTRGNWNLACNRNAATSGGSIVFGRSGTADFCGLSAGPRDCAVSSLPGQCRRDPLPAAELHRSGVAADWNRSAQNHRGSHCVDFTGRGSSLTAGGARSPSPHYRFTLPCLIVYGHESSAIPNDLAMVSHSPCAAQPFFDSFDDRGD